MSGGTRSEAIALTQGFGELRVDGSADQPWAAIFGCQGGPVPASGWRVRGACRPGPVGRVRSLIRD